MVVCLMKRNFSLAIRRKNNSGFTLIELMTSIGVLATIALVLAGVSANGLGSFSKMQNISSAQNLVDEVHLAFADSGQCTQNLAPIAGTAYTLDPANPIGVPVQTIGLWDLRIPAAPVLNHNILDLT